ncbi:MAG: acetylxylan esterase [Bacteroidia bacterium]
MKYFLLLVSLLCMLAGSFAQGIYDVLPSSGRDELFHSFLMDRGTALWNERRDSVAASLTSIQKLEARKQQLRNDYLSLLGELPVKTPLNAVIVDTVSETDYHVELVHFESQPSHHVTANFYIPDTGSAPYPTVLVLCGHYPAAKGDKLLQDLCRLFVTNGIAALVVDPFSQGERAQIQHPTNGSLVFAGQSGTSAHTRLDVGAMLAGTSVVASALWDNHRAIDYLYSRTDVVDTARLGCTGSSGGGAQATYLCAFDERIKVAAVNSFLMNEETLFSTIGPQTGSQNLSYEGAHLIDHPDYVTMFAPKPYMILAGTDDFFDITENPRNLRRGDGCVQPHGRFKFWIF